MNEKHLVDTEEDNKTILEASPPFPVLTPNSVLNVTLEPNEKLEWIWSHYPDGQSVVMGYQIVEKEDSEAIAQEKQILHGS